MSYESARTKTAEIFRSWDPDELRATIHAIDRVARQAEHGHQMVGLVGGREFRLSFDGAGGMEITPFRLPFHQGVDLARALALTLGRKRVKVGPLPEEAFR